jgi:UDPglucose 6-dehydrogenase
MNITIIGTGYVGLTTGICFANSHNVYCVDINKEKIEKLNKGVVPIYEPGLDCLLKKNKKNIIFTTSLDEALTVSDICFIAVGTPTGEDGNAELKYVLSAAADIGRCMQKHTYVVDKSTVPVGTSNKVREAIQEQLNIRKSNLTFDVISNPEFLKEGSAINDILSPDRIIVGIDNNNSKQKMKELYSGSKNIVYMDIASAEMTKYTANAMLATKISFINEISNICERVGADINKVKEGISLDHRIGSYFINPGCGYGGSCFPKDVKALIRTSLNNGYNPKILLSVEETNDKQKKVLVNKIINKFGSNLNGKTFAIWGLSFKPETDDMRESPSIQVINSLVEKGAIVKCYDPKAMEVAKSFYFKKNNSITYCKNAIEASENSDAIIIITDWNEFKNVDFNYIKNIVKSPIVFDGRNIFKDGIKGFEYYQIGVK